MGRSSVRELAIFYVGKGGRGLGASASGGNVVLNAGQHKLDGPEHLAADDTTRLDATTDGHGLLPRLSGNAQDYLDGEGEFVPIRLDDLIDVDALVPADGDILVFQAGGGGSGSGDEGGTWVAVAPDDAGIGGSSGTIWVPVMTTAPSLVTTDGLAVWVPWTTVDGEAVMMELAL